MVESELREGNVCKTSLTFIQAELRFCLHTVKPSFLAHELGNKSNMIGRTHEEITNEACMTRFELRFEQ
jgi:hypothetical protein